MITSINNNVVDLLTPRYAGKSITIGIDSSKTNTAIAIGDEIGMPVDVIEFNGKNDGTTEEAVLALCIKHREALAILLQGAQVVAVGIEDIITKNSKQKESGITIHTSRFKITAVFMSFIFFFQENFHITPMLINNWAWKHEILPEQFRKLDVGKGSLAYYRSIGSKYGSYSDDATDSLCILKFLCSKAGLKQVYKVKEIQAPFVQHKIYLVSTSFVVNADKIRQYEYNIQFTLEQNADVMANEVGKKGIAIATVNTVDLQYHDIYKYCTGTFNRKEDALKLIVVCNK